MTDNREKQSNDIQTLWSSAKAIASDMLQDEDPLAEINTLLDLCRFVVALPQVWGGRLNQESQQLADRPEYAMTRDEAKEKIATYYRKQGGQSYSPRDVAALLGIDPRLVLELTEELGQRERR